jgi:hypothetical protein
MRFQLHIDSDNDAMQTPNDLASALTRVRDEVASGHGKGIVKDDNGNKVGEWEAES